MFHLSLHELFYLEMFTDGRWWRSSCCFGSVLPELSCPTLSSMLPISSSSCYTWLCRLPLVCLRNLLSLVASAAKMKDFQWIAFALQTSRGSPRHLQGPPPALTYRKRSKRTSQALQKCNLCVRKAAVKGGGGGHLPHDERLAWGQENPPAREAALTSICALSHSETLMC